MRSFFLLIPALLFPALLFGQDQSIDSIFERGNEYARLNKHDSAIYMYKKARALALEKQDSATYYKIASNIADNQSRLGQYFPAMVTSNDALTKGRAYLKGIDLAKVYRSMGNAMSRGPASNSVARVYLDSAQSIVSELDGPESTYQQAVLYNDIGIIYYQATNYAETEKYFRQAFNTVIQLDIDEKVAYMACLLANNIGAILKIRGAYNEAIEWHNKAIELAQAHLPNPKGVLGFAYDGIGSVLRDSHDMSNIKALNYYVQALAILREYGAPHDPVITLLGMGLVRQKMGQYEKALEHMLEAKELSEKHLGPQNSKTAWSYSNLADLYGKMDRVEEYYKYHMLCIETLEGMSQTNSQAAQNSYSSLAHFHFSNGNMEMGYEYLLKSEKIVESIFGKTNASSRFYMETADILRVAQEYDSALIRIDKAIDHLQSTTEVKAPIMYKAMQIKVHTLENSYSFNNDLDALHEAYRSFVNVDSLVSEAKASGHILTDELLNQNTYVLWFQLGIRIALKMNELYDRPEYIEKIWELTEASKATVLLAKIQQSKDSELLNVPEEILAKEEDLRNSMDYYQNKARSAQLASDTVSMNRYTLLITEILRENDSLERILEKEYPNYYLSKYQFEFEEITDVQSRLKEDELFISYTISDTTMYAFEVTRHGYEFRETQEGLEFDAAIVDFVNRLKNPSFGPGTAQALQDVSWRISRDLLPVPEKLNKYKKLIIVPIGSLYWFPFELLPTTHKSNINSYKEIDYLIKTHEISYTNSATLLNIQSQTDPSLTKNTIAAFAPAFDLGQLQEDTQYDTTRAGMLELVYTEQEIDQLEQYFPTTLVKGADATEAQFKKLSQEHSILHVASHGKFDERDALNARLVFSPMLTDSLNDGNLFMLELFEMNMNVDMAVLSACNTGVGSYVSGEGVVGLAHSFFYAGSKSLVMSLWNANDQSTSDLINSFYKSLSDGQTKSEAMRSAKLEYLSQADDIRSHPYYWSHMVAFGNNMPLVRQTNWTLYFTLLVLIGAGSAIYLRRRKALKDKDR